MWATIFGVLFFAVLGWNISLTVFTIPRIRQQRNNERLTARVYWQMLENMFDEYKNYHSGLLQRSEQEQPGEKL